MRKFIVLFTAFGLMTMAHGEQQGPCKADVEAFCKGVERGGGRIMKCLKEHERELSAACKAKRAERREKRKDRQSQDDTSE